MPLHVTSCLLPPAPAAAPAQHPKPLITSALVPPSVQYISYSDILRCTAGLQRGAGERGQDCLCSLRKGGPRRGPPMAGGGSGCHAAGANSPGLQLHCPWGAAQGAACFTTAGTWDDGLLLICRLCCCGGLISTRYRQYVSAASSARASEEAMNIGTWPAGCAAVQIGRGFWA